MTSERINRPPRRAYLKNCRCPSECVSKAGARRLACRKHMSPSSIPERERPLAHLPALDALLCASEAAIPAVQLERHRPRAWPGGDVIVAHAAGEDVGEAALRSRDEDIEVPAAGAVEHIETLGTEAGTEIDQVVVASITCQVNLAHDAPLVGEPCAALPEAFFAA